MTIKQKVCIGIASVLNHDRWLNEPDLLNRRCDLAVLVARFDGRFYRFNSVPVGNLIRLASEAESRNVSIL
jgi:hypothetical protein